MNWGLFAIRGFAFVMGVVVFVAGLQWIMRELGIKWSSVQLFVSGFMKKLSKKKVEEPKGEAVVEVIEEQVKIK